MSQELQITLTVIAVVVCLFWSGILFAFAAILVNAARPENFKPGDGDNHLEDE